MNSTTLATKAYAGGTAAARTPRAIEYEVFGRVTRRIKSASEGAQSGLAPLAEALHENLKLWTVIAADIAEPGNGLPDALKARLFYLWEFTRTHTRKVLAGTADAAVLIDINMSVMRGLRGEARPA